MLEVIQSLLIISHFYAPISYPCNTYFPSLSFWTHWKGFVHMNVFGKTDTENWPHRAWINTVSYFFVTKITKVCICTYIWKDNFFYSFFQSPKNMMGERVWRSGNCSHGEKLFSLPWQVFTENPWETGGPQATFYNLPHENPPSLTCRRQSL